MTQHEARRHVLDRPLAGTEFRRRPSEKALALRHPPSFLSPYHVRASNVPFPTRLRPKSSCAEIIECSSDIIDVEWEEYHYCWYVSTSVLFFNFPSFLPSSMTSRGGRLKSNVHLCCCASVSSQFLHRHPRVIAEGCPNADTIVNTQNTSTASALGYCILSFTRQNCISI